MDSFIRFFSIKPGAGYLKRVCEWGYKNQAEGRGHINGWMFMGSLSFISYFFFYYPRLKSMFCLSSF